MYDWENRERNKTISIRLNRIELNKLNELLSKSDERYKSEFFRKLILNEEINMKKDFEFDKINLKLDREFEKANSKLDKLLAGESVDNNNSKSNDDILKSLEIISQTIGRRATSADILKIIENQYQYGFKYLDK